MTSINLKKIILTILLAVLITFSIANILNPNKKEISEKENRTLAKFPKFTIDTLFRGRFMKEFEDWFSDVFIFRDNFLDLNSKYKKYISLDSYVKFEDSIAYIPAKSMEEELDEEDLMESIDSTSDEETDAAVKKFNQKIVEYKEEDYEYEGVNSPVEGVGGGFILYNDIAYVKTNFTLSKAVKYLNIIEEYKKELGDVRTSIVLAPQSSILLYGNKKMKMNLIDQNAKINEFISYASDSNIDINIVNPCKKILDHRDEYLYFKYDHHWTNRGAYYAYQEFCESIGEVPSPIESMDEVVLNTHFRGSSYSFTNDERLKDKTDYLYAYLSTRSNTMAVTVKGGKVIESDNCIRTEHKTYAAFISGDNPFTIINVPSNPQDKCALVLKDSFGCAFVPYLVNNYGNIFVIDPRHSKLDILETIKNYKITDFISVTAIYEPCSEKFRMQTQNLIDIAKKNKEETTN